METTHHGETRPQQQVGSDLLPHQDNNAADSPVLAAGIDRERLTLTSWSVRNVLAASERKRPPRTPKSGAEPK